MTRSLAAQHRADSAQAALKLRDTLANELSIEAQKRATEVGKQVRKRGREDVDLMNECPANTQKVQKGSRVREALRFGAKADAPTEAFAGAAAEEASVSAQAENPQEEAQAVVVAEPVTEEPREQPANATFEVQEA